MRITGASGKQDSQGDLTELCIDVDIDPNDCPAGEIIIEATCRRTDQSVRKRFPTTGSGTQSFCFDQGDLSGFDCSCDDAITVVTRCEDDGAPVSSDDWNGSIDCPGGNCPQFTLQKQSEGGCNQAGTERDVTVCANFSSVPTQSFVQWYFNGNPGPAQPVSPGTGQICTTTTLPAGQSSTVELRVLSPSGCQNKQITVNVSECPGGGGNCPQFTLQKQSEGDCNAAGTKRDVTVCANFSSVPTQSFVHWYFNGNPGTAQTVSPGTGQICTTTSLPEGQSSTVELRVLSPSGCQNKQITVNVSECPGDSKCPKPTSITANPGKCDGTKRKVNLSTTVTNGGSGDEVTWNFGDGDQSTPIDLGNNSDADVTHKYAAPGSGNQKYTVTVVVDPSNSDCNIRTKQSGITVQGCGGDEDCPPLNDKPTANVNGCKNGKREVTFQPPQTASGVKDLEWDFDDGTTTTKNPNQSVTHPYASGGQYTVTVTAKGPGDCEDSSTTKIDIKGCPDCPPLNDKPTANVDGCKDGKREVTFQPPQTASGVNSLEWDFGDGTTTNSQPGQSVTHRYASGGEYTVTVTAKGPDDCEDSSTTKIEIKGCPGDKNGNGGGSFACGIARVGTAVLAAMTIFTALLALCIPGAAQALGIAAGVLAVGAVVLGAVFAVLCDNKPCKWALLMTAQAALGAGVGAAIFSNCCSWLLWAGLGLMILGLVLFVVWKRECNKSWCAVAKEVTYVISGIVLTLVGIASSIPVITGCINGTVLAVVSAIAGLIAAYAASCTS